MIKCGALRQLILFTGPEGSGKTTIAFEIAKTVYKGRSKIVRIRGSHTLAYIFIKFLRDVIGLRGSDLHFYRVRIPEGLLRLWIAIEALSIVPLLILYYYLFRLKYTVISERSILDVLVWILTGVRKPPKYFLRSFFIRLLILLSYRYRRVTFYITADKEVLLNRKPLENFLIAPMLPYYNALARSLGIKRIDTGVLSVDESVDAVLEALNSVKDPQ